jgi:hypothetical protein
MALPILTLMKYAGAKGHAPLFADRITFPGEASYTTTGPAGFQAGFAALMQSNRTILGVIPLKCGDHKPEYNHATDKLLMRVVSTGAEVAGATDLSGNTYEVLVIST